MARIRSRFDIAVVIEKWHETIADVLAGTRVAGDGRVTLPGADGNRRAAGDGLISASSLPGRSRRPARPCAIVITQRLLDWCTGPSQGTVATGAIRWFRDPDPLGPRLKNRPFPERLRFALAGIAYALRAESSFRTHALAAAVALAALVWLRPAPVWWALVALTTVAVLAAELFNTALEQLADRLHPEQHPQIRVAKDCGAAAVLVLSVGAVVVAAALLLDAYAR
jgi:undecaprenol kinase